jgi:hypothetical protein
MTTTFDFSKHANTLKRFLQNVTPNKNSEYEIRFGNFITDKNDRTKKRFDASVEIDYFYRLKSFLKELPGSEFIKTNSIDFSYQIDQDRIRRIVENGQEKFMIKQSQRPIDIYDYNIRLAQSSEKFINKPVGVNWETTVPQIVRIKNRFSYIFPFGRFDLTIVNEGTSETLAKNNTSKYEVEFEVYVNNYDIVVSFIEILLQIKQENFMIITPYERYNIVNQYKQMVGQNGYASFVGAQPQTLHKNQLTLLYKDLYSVTDKADGDRYFMMVDNFGNVYFLDNNLNGILKTDLKSDFRNCLIDGELVREYKGSVLSKMNFYAFDILVLNNRDLRGDTNFLFEKRFENLKKVTDSIKNSELYTCECKQFIYRNVFMGSEIIMADIKNKPYHNDGLIFTPMNEPYPKKNKWENLLKWKPADQNTIDFYSVKKGDYWELYVQHQIKEGQVQGNKTVAQKVLFNINELCASNEIETEITFKTTFPDNQLDPTTSEKFQSDTVIEYKWDTTMKKFVPLRTRWDKTANPRKHGNYSSVACDIWNNIQNPVTLETIYQMTNNSTTSTNSDESFFFERKTVFHRKINSYLSNKYINQGDNLLEINYKKGDSLSLYNERVNNLYGVDFEYINSKTNLANIIKKAKQLKIQNYSFYDTTFDTCVSQTAKNFYKNCNTIFSINNGLTNFFGCQENLSQLIEFLNASLNETGTIIINLIDSNEIKNLENKICIENNEVMYKINPVNVTNCNFNKYNIFVNGITNENDTAVNVIDYDFFITFMKNNGYFLVESDSFRNLYNLSKTFSLKDYEQNISFLWKYCVFSKKQPETESESSFILPLPIKNHDIDKTIVLTDNQINLNNNKNVNLYKLESCTDILDILNCVEFKYKECKNTQLCLDNFTEFTKDLGYIPIIFNNSTKEQDFPKNSLVFYKYTYIETVLTEQKEEIEETVTLIYLVLYKNMLKYDYKLLFTELNPPTEQVINQEQITTTITNVTEKLENVTLKSEPTIKQRFEECTKITIPVLKSFLKELNLKTTGSKNELQERLTNALN